MDKPVPQKIIDIQSHLPHWDIQQIKNSAIKELIRQEEELVDGILHKQPRDVLREIIDFEQSPVVDVEIKKPKKK